MKRLSYNDKVFICLFYMKIIASVINLHQDHGPCYLHLPIFFLYIYSPVLLFCCKIKGSCEGFHKLRARLRPWTWGARKRRYAYTKIHARYWFPSVKIIWICQFAFFFFFFFLLCAWMVLSCITSCEGHKLWKLSTVHWCYQHALSEKQTGLLSKKKMFSIS